MLRKKEEEKKTVYVTILNKNLISDLIFGPEGSRAVNIGPIGSTAHYYRLCSAHSLGGKTYAVLKAYKRRKQ